MYWSVGAGPCGLGVGVAARAGGPSCTPTAGRTRAMTLYPLYGTFFSTPEKLEMGVAVRDRGGEADAAGGAALYRSVVAEHQLDVRQYERGRDRGSLGDFVVRTRKLRGEAGISAACRLRLATSRGRPPRRAGRGAAEGQSLVPRGRALLPAGGAGSGGGTGVEAALDLFARRARLIVALRVVARPASSRGAAAMLALIAKREIMYLVAAVPA